MLNGLTVIKKYFVIPHRAIIDPRRPLEEHNIDKSTA